MTNGWMDGKGPKRGEQTLEMEDEFGIKACVAQRGFDKGEHLAKVFGPLRCFVLVVHHDRVSELDGVVNLLPLGAFVVAISVWGSNDRKNEEKEKEEEEEEKTDEWEEDRGICFEKARQIFRISDGIAHWDVD